MNHKNYFLAAPMALSTLLLTACSSSRFPAAIERAQVEVLAAQRDNALMTHAPLVVAESASALRNAEETWKRTKNEAEVDHLVYLSQQTLNIAHEKSREQTSQSLTREQLVGSLLAAQRLKHQAENQGARLGRLEQASANNRDTLRELQMGAERNRGNSFERNRNDAKKQITVASDMLFEAQTAKLKPGAMLNFNSFMEDLKQYPNRTIIIEGHTDSVGPKSSNQILSQRRADAVAGLLIDYGIDGSRISSKGLGEEFPLKSNQTEAGRVRNRRVQIVVADF